jgi:hypothetical protein
MATRQCRGQILIELIYVLLLFATVMVASHGIFRYAARAVQRSALTEDQR